MQKGLNAMSLTFFNHHFTPSWRITVAALCGLLFFGRLGFWQLERGQQKKTMLSTQANWAKQAPIAWKPGQSNPQPYQRLSLEGCYLKEILLLDNQHYQHQLGFEVISPLLLEDGNLVLVDRGWIAADTRRRTLPKLPSLQGRRQLSGSAYYPLGNKWLLGEAIESKATNIVLLERLDLTLIAHFLHKSIYPFIIRLAEKEKNGYVRDWPVVAMRPERHYAYALQWFALALLILILFFALNLKKNDGKKS